MRFLFLKNTLEAARSCQQERNTAVSLELSLAIPLGNCEFPQAPHLCTSSAQTRNLVNSKDNNENQNIISSS